jgi:predicted metal-binding protein
MEKTIPRKVKEHISKEEIRDDLKRYQEEVLKIEGITSALIIGRDGIYVDPRVPYKCSIPKCHSYGTCIHCPPHAISAEETQKLVNHYDHAIFLKMDLPSDIVAGKELSEAVVSGGLDPEKKIIQTGRACITIGKAVSRVESMAFYDGYYLAMGFSSASCKAVLCGKFPNCEVLEGRKCRHPYFARPSMEAAGFDALRMAAKQGWDVYPIGSSCFPEDVPHGTFMGLILIT